MRTPDKNNPLFKMDNVIFSPHVAGASDNSLKIWGWELQKCSLRIEGRIHKYGVFNK